MEEKVSYTVISEGAEAPSATVVDNILDALSLARFEAEKAKKEVTIATENGWFLSLDELENMVRQ